MTFRPNRSGQLCDALRRLPVPREPEWEDFIDAEGRLLPIEHLRSESPEERDQRRRKIDLMLAQRQKLFQHVAGAGAVLPGTTRAEKAILNRDHARLMRAIADRVRAYQDHFRLPDEERRRQRTFQQEEHGVEEIRREILQRKAMWEERQRTAPDVAIDDLPPQYRRDSRQRMAVVRDQLDRQQKERLRSALYLPEAAQSDIRLQTAGLPGPVRDRAERAARFVGRIVRKNVLAQAEIPVIIVPTLEDEGAGYNETLRAILAHPNAADRAFVHEIGHDLSMRLPSLDEQAKMWRKQVTRGGSLGLGSTKDSVGDRWFYRQRTDGVPQVRPIDQYITREYPDHDAHEVVSVGLEQLFVEPERIAEDDQKLFELLLKGFRR